MLLKILNKMRSIYRGALKFVISQTPYVITDIILCCRSFYKNNSPRQMLLKGIPAYSRIYTDIQN